MAAVTATMRLTDMMTRPLINICNAMNVTISTVERLAESTSRPLNTAALGDARDLMASSVEELSQMCGEQERLNDRIRDGVSGYDGLLGKVKGLVGAYVGMQGIKKLVNLSDTTAQTTARLGMIVDDGGSVKELEDKIFASAQRSRMNYQTVADSVSKLSLMTSGVFANNDETVAFAEALSSHFKVAGTNAAGIDAAMLQMTQAMGGGVLRGEELNTILEQAPNIAMTIAEYMKTDVGHIRKIAAEGKITSDIVKNAMLDSLGTVGEQARKMPYTWSEIWTMSCNSIQRALRPLLNLISAMADNWSVIRPVVVGVAAAIGVYAAVMGAVRLKAMAAAAAETVHNAAIAFKTKATFAATSAQYGFNTALLACPITWIVGAIIILITALYAIVAAVNKVKGTSYSAMGYILAVLFVFVSSVLNAVIGLINSIIQAVWSVADVFGGFFEWIYNLFNGGFDSLGDSFKNLCGQILAGLLSLAQIAAPLIDAIFGTNINKTIDKWKTRARSWGKNDKAKNLSGWSAPQIQRIQYEDAWQSGYDIGKGFDKKLSKMFGGNLGEDIAEGLGEIEKNTKDTADALDVTSNDLKYLRDLAERDAVNRFTTAQLNVNFTSNSTISGSMDIDGIVSELSDKIVSELESVAEGVHAT